VKRKSALNVGGRRIKAVAQITKMGFTFVFDRVTGAPVWPIEERPVPKRRVNGKQYVLVAIGGLGHRAEFVSFSLPEVRTSSNGAAQP
jgi:hypothetical protein